MQYKIQRIHVYEQANVTLTFNKFAFLKQYFPHFLCARSKENVGILFPPRARGTKCVKVPLLDQVWAIEAISTEHLCGSKYKQPQHDVCLDGCDFAA